MQGWNHVEFIGNLGCHPQMRHTGSGKAVVNLRLAVTTGFGDSQRTDWLTIVAWDKLAEACRQYLAKGSRIFVAGRLQIRQWQGEDGQTRYSTEVVARQVIFLDRPNATGGSDEDQGDEEPDIPF